jgi:hypothetical protein
MSKMLGRRNAKGSMKVGSAEFGGGLLGELPVYLGELSGMFPAAGMIMKSLSAVGLPTMAWRFPVAPVKVDLANLTRWPPARPTIRDGA